MCHDPAARPPMPPIAGASGEREGRRLVLEAEDGNRFRAHAATAADPGGAGIVVLPDIRGLHPFYEDLAERFADAGVHAVAIDYFGRTAGVDDRADDFDFRAHMEQTTPDTVATDIAAAIAHLRSREGGGAEAVFTVGFCFGGRKSFNEAARDHGVAGVIGFYGWPAARDDDDHDAPVRLAASYRAPVLGLFGGADERIPKTAVDAFRAALDGAGVPNEIVVYDGAPHSFFDRSFDEHRDAGEDAWRRMLRFIEANR